MDLAYNGVGVSAAPWTGKQLSKVSFSPQIVKILISQRFIKDYLKSLFFLN
jgi:hypothetical protein